MARPVQVAWTAARARHCGFYFDPAKLRRDFLAAEAARAGDPAWLPKAEKAYDFTYVRVASALKGKSGYCTERTVDEIRTDLKRHLAGNYTPRPRKKKEDSGTMFGFLSADDADDKMPSREEIFDPNR